jgi:hypothetical protein
MTTQTERQPAGIPGGGQFAATQHAEPDLALEAPDTVADDYWDEGDNCSCGNSLDDGQGWDGKCGDCADIAANTDECSGCGDLLEDDEKADGICEECSAVL